jgi:hypothetical protein
MRISLRHRPGLSFSHHRNAVCAGRWSVQRAAARAAVFVACWTGLFWFAFWKYKLLRYAGFIWVLPISLLAFEIL